MAPRDLAIHHGTVGLADDELRPGRVLVLEVPSADAVRLAPGVALDDYIPDGARTAVDTAAWSQMRAWRELRSGDLTSDGLDLTHVWEVELVATCFLPFARLRAALPPAVAALGPRRLVGVGLTPEMLALVAAVAGELGVRTVRRDARGGSAGPPAQARNSLAVRMVAAAGWPARVRGNVVCVPYWHLEPVFTRLAAPSSPVRPVASGVLIPLSNRGDRLRAARRGGWLGHPSGRSRARSRAKIASLLDGLDAGRAPTPEGAADALALAELRRMAQDTFAHASQARRAFATGRPRLVVVPYDSPENTRILLAAAHAAGVRSLLVQHGFDATLNVPDKTVARHVAVWSRRDRDYVRARSAAAVTVTGNPGASHLEAAAGRRATRSGRSLVLVDYASRLSVRVGARVSSEHVAAALAALAQARPNTTAVIRPHPSDPYPHHYLRLAAAHPGLVVAIDAATPMEQLLATTDLCIGALSTATLQAAVLGVPVVFLDVAGIERPWPFGGENGLPRARSAPELSDMLVAALGRRDVDGQAAAAEALGVRGDAVDRVCELVEELARGADGPGS